MADNGGKKIGIYDASIVSVGTDGTYKVHVHNIRESDTETPLLIDAVASQVMGGRDSSAGIKTYPQKGDKCYVVFKAGNTRMAVIVGYAESTRSGTSGVNPGDFVIKTEKNVRLVLNNDENQFELMNADKYGLSMNTSVMEFKHRKYKMYADDDVVATEYGGGKAAVYYIPGASGELYTTAQRYALDVGEHMTYSANRSDNVTGNWFLQSDNNIKLNASAISVVGSSNVTISTMATLPGGSAIGVAGEVKVMTGYLSMITINDIIQATKLGGIYHYATAGSVTLAAGPGTVGATEASVAGLSVLANGFISISQTGMIEVNSLQLGKTVYMPSGLIKEDAVNFIGNYTTSYSAKSLGTITIDADTLMTVRSTSNMLISSSANMMISANTGLVIDSKAQLIMISTSAELTASSMVTITAGLTKIISPQIKVTMGAPINGLQVMTLMGPQMIQPVPGA